MRCLELVSRQKWVLMGHRIVGAIWMFAKLGVLFIWESRNKGSRCIGSILGSAIYGGQPCLQVGQVPVSHGFSFSNKGLSCWGYISHAESPLAEFVV